MTSFNFKIPSHFVATEEEGEREGGKDGVCVQKVESSRKCGLFTSFHSALTTYWTQALIQLPSMSS
jgi:hypothetical protein